jgi:hypothetical protein
MGIREPISEISKILELTDPGKILGFVQDSKGMFREIKILGMAPVCS